MMTNIHRVRRLQKKGSPRDFARTAPVDDLRESRHQEYLRPELAAPRERPPSIARLFQTPGFSPLRVRWHPSDQLTRTVAKPGTWHPNEAMCRT
jgi:hypothetical protein